MVVMDAGLCRSGRTSCPAGSEAFGYASGTEEGKRCWGGKPSPLGRQEGVRRDAEHPVMVEALPAAPFVVIQSQLVFQLLVVALDPPADLYQPHEIIKRHVLRDVREPVLRRFTLPRRPLHQDPLRFPRPRPPVV